MSLANDIINGKMPDFDYYLRQGETLDDADEYGFTPLIESVICSRTDIAKLLLNRGVDVNNGDMTRRTALHWSVYNNNTELTKLLLSHHANPNAYTTAGLSILVFPLLREQTGIKHLLYQHGAKLDFPSDFILGKLIGHRFELQGSVSILNAEGVFIELDYEGFILEFTVAIISDSLKRFSNSYSTRYLREQYSYIYNLIDAFSLAAELLRFQQYGKIRPEDTKRIGEILKAPLLIFPAASRGHAMGFIKYHNWWAKVDRGENSLKEGSINIYRITHPERLTIDFLETFLFRSQPRQFFHQTINTHLGLLPMGQIPISSQISGNCSWANIQALVLVGITLQKIQNNVIDSTEARVIYDNWVQWDQDRAIDECIQRFYHSSNARKASMASMLGSILFNYCVYKNPHHLIWAEKILTILTLPDYYYILQSYLEIYCIKRLTFKGNNLLKILDDCGVNPQIEVHPVATDRLTGKTKGDRKS